MEYGERFQTVQEHRFRIRRLNHLTDWGLIMPNLSQPVLARREANLISIIKATLPNFARACHEQDVPAIILHQDAIAADYQEEEYHLLGMAIEFAGINSRDVVISGINRGSLDPITPQM